MFWFLVVTSAADMRQGLQCLSITASVTVSVFGPFQSSGNYSDCLGGRGRGENSARCQGVDYDPGNPTTPPPPRPWPWPRQFRGGSSGVAGSHRDDAKLTASSILIGEAECADRLPADRTTPTDRRPTADPRGAACACGPLVPPL